MRLSDLNGEFFVSLDSQRLETANRRLQKWLLPCLAPAIGFQLAVRRIKMQCRSREKEQTYGNGDRGPPRC